MFAASPNSANKEAARKLIDEAALHRNDAAPDVKVANTFDAANMALYDSPPDGFRRALGLLNNDTVKSDTPGRLLVLRACANGPKYLNQVKNLTDVAKLELRQTIIGDLKASLRRNKQLESWVRYLITLDQAANRSVGQDQDDDLSFLTMDEAKDILAVCNPNPAEPPPADQTSVRAEGATQTAAVPAEGAPETPGQGVDLTNMIERRRNRKCTCTPTVEL